MRTVVGSLFIYKGLNDNNGVMDHAYIGYAGTMNCGGYTPVCRLREVEGYCTPDEIQTIHNSLKKIGKQWNAEKKCIEDIPQRKFKAGDKVRIKEGISSKTKNSEYINFTSGMDNYIGKTMVVRDPNDFDDFLCVLCEGSDWNWLEDWLEPWSEKLFKKGDAVTIKAHVDENSGSLSYLPGMNKYVGKKLIYSKLSNDSGNTAIVEGCPYVLCQEWLELYKEKYIIGEWYFFYDSNTKYGVLRKLERIDKASLHSFRDFTGLGWKNAILWNGTKEHLNDLFLLSKD